MLCLNASNVAKLVVGGSEFQTFTISCSSKARLVLPSWFYLSGAGSPGKSRTKSKTAVKQLCVCVIFIHFKVLYSCQFILRA